MLVLKFKMGKTSFCLIIITNFNFNATFVLFRLIAKIRAEKDLLRQFTLSLSTSMTEER